jgi:hypothetical protein
MPWLSSQCDGPCLLRLGSWYVSMRGGNAPRTTPLLVMSQVSGDVGCTENFWHARENIFGGGPLRSGRCLVRILKSSTCGARSRWRGLMLNGTNDLTLIQFCMTLTDRDEIIQYLTAYLGSCGVVDLI